MCESTTSPPSAGGSPFATESLQLLGEMVPQRPYLSRNSKIGPARGAHRIDFTMKEGGGFAVRDALDENYVGLVLRDDTTMFVHCSSSISIRFEVSVLYVDYL